MNFTWPRSVAAAVLVTAGLLTGCGDGPGSGSSSSVAKMEAKIAGSVSNNNGVVNDGKLEVKDKSGALVASVNFSGGRYSIAVPASANYPILLTATPAGGGEANGLKAAVTSPIAERMDISSVTTDIVNNAIILGGLTEQNIAKASGGAIGLRQSQGVSAASGGSSGGPGNTGGGAGTGAHAGHNMDDMRSSTPTTTPTPAP